MKEKRKEKKKEKKREKKAKRLECCSQGHLTANGQRFRKWPRQKLTELLNLHYASDG